MDKTKVYKIAGKVCIILWFTIVVSWTVGTAYKTAEAGHGHFVNGIFFFFIVYGFSHFFLNPFLFVGGVFFWRAEKNENPAKKSAWGRSVILYLIAEIIFIILCARLIFPALKLHHGMS